MPTQLTIVIPFLNEGNEVANTVASIRATTVTDPCITLINDASVDGYGYEEVAQKYGCRYVENAERLGVAASRNLGVRESQTPYFLLLDGHMRFYENGWDERLVKLLNENPRSVLCGQTKWLDKEDDGTVTLKKIPTPYGAYVKTALNETLTACWSVVDMSPCGNLSEIACILGAAYACSKDYWEYLRGLDGLLYYGVDEQLLSAKVWSEGGRCLLVRDWEVGHVYRQQAPYKMEQMELFYNKLFMLELLFPYDMKKDFFAYARIANKAIYTEAYNLLKKRYAALKAQRKYLSSIFEKDISYFWAINQKVENANGVQR